jgi:hypothetical protein
VFVLLKIKRLAMYSTLHFGLKIGAVHGAQNCSFPAVTVMASKPWARRFAGSKVRLGLLTFNSCICTSPCVLQQFALSTMLPSVAPLLSVRCRCGKAGAVERHPRIPARFAD